MTDPLARLPPNESQAHLALRKKLNDLYYKAGAPSIRLLAKETLLSKSTVSRIISEKGGSTPRWEVLRVIVEALNGDTEEFRTLWTKARVSAREASPSAEIFAQNVFTSGGIDRGVADNVAKLVESLANVDSAVIAIGNILIVKSKGRLVVTEVDGELNKRLPSILSDPDEALAAIQGKTRFA